MKNNVVSADLSDFGYREIELAKDLLTAYVEQGVPENFYDHEIKIMFNNRSGLVFIVNSDYQVLLLNGENLEMFYVLPYSGEEGFADELKELYQEDPNYFHEEDIEYMKYNNIIE